MIPRNILLVPSPTPKDTTPMTPNSRASLILLFSTALAACGGPGGEAEPKPVDFATQIKPLLQTNCIVCHNTGTLVGKINLENRELAFGESERGKFIVPGDPEASLLYTITLAPHGKRELPDGIEKPMPALAPDLAPEEKDLLKRWIQEGADWPSGADGHVKLLPDPEPES